MFLSNKLKMWLSATSTDMRKSINGLCFLVVDTMKLDPVSGELFIFYNKSFNKLKILYWDTNGFCLWYKRLEKHRFKLPDDISESLVISSQQLRWLLEGLDFTKMKGNIQLKYDTFF
jgi:transposase